MIEIDLDFFLEHCEYDPSVDSCLKMIKLWSDHPNFKLKAGDSIGYKQFQRKGIPHCFRVNVFGTNFQVHRIIYSIVYGKLEKGYVIDHINGNPFDNRIENLRSILPELNARNAKKRIDNKTGVAGVRIQTNKQGKKYLIATYKKNKKDVFKVWKLDQIPLEKALFEAVSWRKQMLLELDNGYTDRHYKYQKADN